MKSGNYLVVDFHIGCTDSEKPEMRNRGFGVVHTIMRSVPYERSTGTDANEYTTDCGFMICDGSRGNQGDVRSLDSIPENISLCTKCFPNVA